MALDPEFLRYPRRRRGMDHDRYEWSQLHEREQVEWPGGARLALWINVCVQFYPLNQRGKPFPTPGGMTMPYPDLRHFSLREYGNRVGIFRLLDACDRFGAKPSFAVNGAMAERAPWLISVLRERGDEILAHGWNMDSLHHGGLAPEEESELIDRSLDSLQEAFGAEIRGWLSPARNESPQTPDLLAERGVHWFADWVNDDMPYRFHTDNGNLWAMPLSNELEDRFILMQNLHSEESWVEQVCDACDFLLKEAEDSGGRILSLNLHPWLMGQPHRIAHLEQALGYITSQPDVWPATPSEILQLCK
ncbi:MAG: polysaccharide deacetylase family protein [Gammaproteobacteria bacterium]|nr:polysaccharide deacetylase family protein [Gammaproteobacteria bacterium]MYH86852.1 polysaccharide deacetylase family protein [Gammaproteobacteria bacterium]MYK06125.1 polysaccharide deacetylase family protein [Gammaproteobacteria bacterium]